VDQTQHTTSTSHFAVDRISNNNQKLVHRPAEGKPAVVLPCNQPRWLDCRGALHGRLFRGAYDFAFQLSGRIHCGSRECSTVTLCNPGYSDIHMVLSSLHRSLMPTSQVPLKKPAECTWLYRCG
jgi:hypothetical protein